MKTAADHIIAVLDAADSPMYLHEIQHAIQRRFGVIHSETAISARIRDRVRPHFEAMGCHVLSKAPRGKSAHQYRLVRPCA